MTKIEAKIEAFFLILQKLKQKLKHFFLTLPSTQGLQKYFLHYIILNPYNMVVIFHLDNKLKQNWSTRSKIEAKLKQIEALQ